jgi:predicted O-methyltransferase YrrM
MRSELARIPGLRRTFRRAKALSNVVRRRDHPTSVAVSAPNMEVVDFVREHGYRRIGEIGCYRGHTTLELARLLDGEGSIHIFDFEENVSHVVGKLREEGFASVVGLPSSHRRFDSYNWPLMRLLQEHHEPIWDFVFIDGAHTFAHDALAFLLAERLLGPGGAVWFDDYDWSFAISPTMNPDIFPATRRNWTEEQIAEEQVRLIVETLVRPDPRWREVVPNHAFEKIA